MKKMVLLAPLVLVGFAAFITVGGFVVQQLWNWLLPPLVGWPALTFWQALGILALCRILFGGFGMHGGRSRFRRRFRERFEARLEERFAELTPEERERFREHLRERWGCGPTTGEGQET